MGKGEGKEKYSKGKRNCRRVRKGEGKGRGSSQRRGDGRVKREGDRKEYRGKTEDWAGNGRREG